MTRTVAATGYGGPEVLVVQGIPLPHQGHQQVLIDVRAAGTDEALDKVFPLATAAAHRYLRAGRAHGKVVLVP